MVKIVSGNDNLCKKLVEIFGLKGTNPRALTVHVEIGKPVTVTIERYVQRSEMEGFVDALEDVKPVIIEKGK